jgi:hypothetical protein
MKKELPDFGPVNISAPFDSGLFSNWLFLVIFGLGMG